MPCKIAKDFRKFFFTSAQGPHNRRFAMSTSRDRSFARLTNQPESALKKLRTKIMKITLLKRCYNSVSH